MKKIILVLFALSVLYTANAQSESDKKIIFGAKAGVNLSHAIGNGVGLFTNGKSPSSRLGISLGVLLEYKISNKFYIQPEVVYSQQGFKTGSSNNTVKLDYINIPIMTKYNVSDAFSLEGGPQFGFLLSSKSNSEDQLNSAVDKSLQKRSALEEADLKNFFAKTDFGINFGLTYQLKSGLGFNARYNLGLKDIFDFTNTTNNHAKKKSLLKSDDDYVIKNRVFQVSILYKFK